MALRLVTPPAVEPVTPAETRDAVRIETSADDLLLATYIRAARRQAEGVLGRALVNQTWRYTADAFPAGPLALPLPPLVSVTAVKTYDDAGTPTTVDPGTYYVRTGDGEDGAGGGVELVNGASWPVAPALRLSEGVEVTYVAGYGTSPFDVPDDVRVWIMMRVGDLYRNRESVAVGTTATRLGFVDGLLDPYVVRVYG